MTDVERTRRVWQRALARYHATPADARSDTYTRQAREIAALLGVALHDDDNAPDAARDEAG